MKDSKIDEVLDEHLNDYNSEVESNQILLLLGENFVAELAEIFEEEDLNLKLDDAKALMNSFLGSKQIFTSSEKTKNKINQYKEYLLKSFLIRPNLSFESRKLYIEVYMKCEKNKNKKSVFNHEEEITRKALDWFNEYKRQNPKADLQNDFSIAIMAITDEVYNEILEEKPKTLKK